MGAERVSTAAAAAAPCAVYVLFLQILFTFGVVSILISFLRLVDHHSRKRRRHTDVRSPDVARLLALPVRLPLCQEHGSFAFDLEVCGI